MGDRPGVLRGLRAAGAIALGAAALVLALGGAPATAAEPQLLSARGTDPSAGGGTVGRRRPRDPARRDGQSEPDRGDLPVDRAGRRPAQGEGRRAAAQPLRARRPAPLRPVVAPRTDGAARAAPRAQRQRRQASLRHTPSVRRDVGHEPGRSRHAQGSPGGRPQRLLPRARKGIDITLLPRARKGIEITLWTTALAPTPLTSPASGRRRAAREIAILELGRR